MKTKVSLLLAIALTTSIAHAQGSTTSVSASASNGDISGYIGVYYDQSCMDIYYESNLSLDLNEDWFYEVGSQFDSVELGNLVFGPGTYSVTAYFDGFDGQYSDGTPCSIGDSDGGASVTVPGPVASATTLIGPGGGVREGTPLILTVDVTATDLFNNGPTPTGTAIIFYGSTVLASSKKFQLDYDADSVTGTVQFTFPTVGVSPGNYSLNAAYGGDSNFTSSSSSPITVSITQPKVSSTAALAVSPATVVQGNAITLTATVTPNVSGITPTGMVSFLAGSTSIGTAKLNSSGVATLTESTTGIPPAVYGIDASYGGDTYDYASVSSTQNVTVQAATATALTANPTTVTEGQTVNLTAKVKRTQSSGPPTGNVAFQFAGYTFATTPLNGSGVATASISTKNLGSGTYPLAAIYNGDTLDATSTSATVTVTVQ